MIDIDSTPIRYLSHKDEDSFFAWAKEISCVASVDGGVLRIKADQVSDDELRELLGLLTRYQLPIEPLRALVNESNRHWFDDPHAYWNAT